MLSARLWVLGLGALLVLAVAGYGAALPRATGSLKGKLGLLAIFLSVVLGLVFGQLDIYTAITGEPKPMDSDYFVFAILMSECLVGMAIIFFFAWRMRQRDGDAKRTPNRGKKKNVASNEDSSLCISVGWVRDNGSIVDFAWRDVSGIQGWTDADSSCPASAPGEHLFKEGRCLCAGRRPEVHRTPLGLQALLLILYIFAYGLWWVQIQQH